LNPLLKKSISYSSFVDSWLDKFGKTVVPLGLYLFLSESLIVQLNPPVPVVVLFIRIIAGRNPNSTNGPLSAVPFPV
jgi:hypothetical protein